MTDKEKEKMMTMKIPTRNDDEDENIIDLDELLRRFRLRNELTHFYQDYVTVNAGDCECSCVPLIIQLYERERKHIFMTRYILKRQEMKRKQDLRKSKRAVNRIFAAAAAHSNPLFSSLQEEEPCGHSPCLTITNRNKHNTQIENAKLSEPTKSDQPMPYLQQDLLNSEANTNDSKLAFQDGLLNFKNVNQVKATNLVSHKKQQQQQQQQQSNLNTYNMSNNIMSPCPPITFTCSSISSNVVLGGAIGLAPHLPAYFTNSAFVNNSHLNGLSSRRLPFRARLRNLLDQGGADDLPVERSADKLTNTSSHYSSTVFNFETEKPALVLRVKTNEKKNKNTNQANRVHIDSNADAGVISASTSMPEIATATQSSVKKTLKLRPVRR